MICYQSLWRRASFELALKELKLLVFSYRLLRSLLHSCENQEAGQTRVVFCNSESCNVRKLCQRELSATKMGKSGQADCGKREIAWALACE